MQGVQSVIENLNIERVEIRSEEDDELKEYSHAKQTETVVVKLDDAITSIQQDFQKVLKPVLIRLVNNKAFYSTDVDAASSFSLIQARDKFRKVARGGNPVIECIPDLN